MTSLVYALVVSDAPSVVDTTLHAMVGLTQDKPTTVHKPATTVVVGAPASPAGPRSTTYGAQPDTSPWRCAPSAG